MSHLTERLSKSSHSDSLRSEKREVKELLREADKPLSHDEIRGRSDLNESEIRRVVGELVDTGELTSTVDWKFELSDR